MDERLTIFVLGFSRDYAKQIHNHLLRLLGNRRLRFSPVTLPGRETLVPIPNTTVKPPGPMIVPKGVKVGYRRGLLRLSFGRAFFVTFEKFVLRDDSNEVFG
jgi:hypothetical protein